MLSRGIISCAKKVFPLKTKPRKDSVSADSWNIINSRKQARIIVLGAPHQLRWLSLTFAAWARRLSVVNAVAAEVRDLHMRCAFALVMLSKASSRLLASLRNDRKQWRLQVQHHIQFDAAAGFSMCVFRGIARLVKKPMAPSPKLQLEDGSRTIDERQATERWLRFASERHDGQPTSATALLETIVQARSIFAATVRQEWVCPSLPDVVHLFGRVKPGRAWEEDLLPPDLFRRFQQELGQLFHPLYVKALMAIEEPVQWRGEIWCSPKKVHRTIVAKITETLPWPVCQACCFTAGDVRL